MHNIEQGVENDPTYDDFELSFIKSLVISDEWNQLVKNSITLQNPIETKYNWDAVTR